MGTSAVARRNDVLSFGELIVDFVAMERGVPLRRVSTFAMHQGGAPANVARGLARLGRRAAMMGAVGEDEFGAFLREALAGDGVDVSAVVAKPAVATAVTFVAVQLNGERTFHFSRQTSADLQFGPEDVVAEAVQSSRIFHFGSNLLVQDRGAGATAWAREVAREAGCLVSYDPNIRLHLWEGRHALAVERARACLPGAHLVKVSDEENALLAPNLGPREAFNLVYRPAGTIALCVTHGARGSTVVTEQLEVSEPGIVVDVVDTTGAGDGFVAGLLSGLCGVLERGSSDEGWPGQLRDLDEGTWRGLLKRANVAGACVCTRLGASAALPTSQEISRWGV